MNRVFWSREDRVGSVRLFPHLVFQDPLPPVFLVVVSLALSCLLFPENEQMW